MFKPLSGSNNMRIKFGSWLSGEDRRTNSLSAIDIGIMIVLMW